MSHSFLAFIDESGDDGIGKFREPGAQGGSSSWLCISACIFRQAQNLEPVKWRDDIRVMLPKKGNRKDIHFKELDHNQKVAVARMLSDKPIRFVNVMYNKRTAQPDTWSQKNQLYFYLTRYLVERISWLCRDLRKQVPEGDGRVQITFSRRGGMSYPDFQNYMTRLKKSDDNDVRIHWPVIDIESISAQDHSTSASLQMADIGASSFWKGLEPDPYGNCECRYAEILKPKTYHRNGNYASYGMKVVSNHRPEDLTPDQKHMLALFPK